MRVLCPQHGICDGMLLSSDLWGCLKAGQQCGRVLVVRYEHLGDVVWVHYVSPEFAEMHGLVEGISPLPPEDDPIEWVHDLRPWCDKCFKESQHGYFDEEYRWHQLDSD